MPRFSLVLAALAVVAAPVRAQDNGISPTTTIWSGVYSEEQAAQGERLYETACGDCHGKELDGDPGQGFPALASPGFMVEWDRQTMADLVRHMHTRPNDNPGDMDPLTAVQMTAFILKRNGVPSGKTPLSTDVREEAKILFTQEKPK